MKIRREIRSMFKQEGSIEKRLFWFAAIIALFIELISFVTDHMMGFPFKMTGIYVATMLITIIMMIIARCTAGYRVSYTVFSLIINMILIPVSFVVGGGFYSGMPCYVFLGIVMCALNPSAKSRFITVGVVLLWDVLFYILLQRFGIVIEPLPDNVMAVDQIISLFISGVAILIMLSVVVNDIRKIYTMNIREYGERTRMRLELLESQAENIEEAKRQRSEMRRHNMIIAEYAEKGDFDGLTKYLSDKQTVDERYNKKAIYCMNSTINSILGIYARQAVNKKVPMEIRTDVSQELPIPEPELVTLVSNVLENAISGAEHCGAPEKMVIVDIHTKSEKLVINVKNSCTPEIQEQAGYGRQMGIGINIVEKIVNANGGIMDCNVENGMAQCRIVINVGGKGK